MLINTLLRKCNNDSVTVHLFLYLLVASDSRGTVTTTLQKLALELNTTVDKVRLRLKHLKRVGLIATPTKNRRNTKEGTNITICNYESYTMLELWESHNNTAVTPPKKEKEREKEKENVSPIPPIKEKEKEKEKENSSSSSSAHTCAQAEFLPLLRSDRIWGEVIEMRFQLSPNSLGRWIDTFSLDLQCRDVAHRNLQDAKRHFCDWLRIQLQSKAKTDGQKNYTTSKAEHIAAERERIMRKISSSGIEQDDTPSWLK